MLCVLALSSARATHLVGIDGHVTYTDTIQDGIRKYEIEISLYRDADVSWYQFDNSIQVGIYKQYNLVWEKSVTLNLISENLVPNKLGTFNRGLYRASFTRNEIGNFIVQYQRCCAADAQNVLANRGWDLSIHVPFFLTKGVPTSNLKGTPILQINYRDTLKLDTLWNFPWADSTVIKYGTFYMGGTSTDPIPTLRTYYTVDSSSKIYLNSYNSQLPLGTNGVFSITKGKEFRIKTGTMGSYQIPINYLIYKHGLLVATYNQAIFFYGLNQNPPTSVQGAKLPISFYPNPAKNFIRLASSKEDKYDILNANGQVLLRGPLVVGENEINLSKLASGLYWVQTAQGTRKLSIVR